MKSCHFKPQHRSKAKGFTSAPCPPVPGPGLISSYLGLADRRLGTAAAIHGKIGPGQGQEGQRKGGGEIGGGLG